MRQKVPSSGELWMVYDAHDRVVLTQDANMRNSAKKQWLYTQYDQLNRPITTGIITDNSHYNDLGYHTERADTSIRYPPIINYTSEELTHTFYDNYGWRSSYGNPLNGTYRNNYDTSFLTASNSVWPYAQAPQQSLTTYGKITGTRTKILGTSNYLYSIPFYDEKSRLIQVQETNVTGGENIITTQYNWSGQPVVIVNYHQKSGNNPQYYSVVTKMQYDDLGRLANIKKAIYSSTMNLSEQVIVANSYDALGRLVKKTLGNGMDSISYDYNIRGWLLGANRIYAKDPTNTTHHFGFDLAYDKSALTVNGQSVPYTDSLFNGNIAGMLWKSAGDNQVRRYDFSYDPVNRLTNANFNQFTGSTFNTTSGINFSAKGLSYDANGNILTMNHLGWKLGGNVTIDSLAYHYLSYSNKLKNVIDHTNDANTKLGDFRTSSLYTASLGGTKTSSATDYVYDNNGSMVKDLNKDIGDESHNGIVYNHLNLPAEVTVYAAGGTTKGVINYIYDALGNKLQKIVQETGKPDNTTLYLSGSIYENDTLQFVGHEEGRTRLTKRYYINGDSAMSFQNDYFLKDHLGNVRIMLTDQKDTALYMATMETAYRSKEDQLFSNIGSSSYAASLIPGGYPADATTSPNDSLSRVTGSGPKIGPSLVLKSDVRR